LEPFTQHVTIDLEQTCEIYAIGVWHYHKQKRVYLDVVVQVAREGDADFTTDVQTVFNNDDDNSSGLGVGSDKNYVETSEGKLIDVFGKGVKGRYVRLYSNGNNAWDENHYLEVEVYGKPAAGLTVKPGTNQESSRSIAPQTRIKSRGNTGKRLRHEKDEEREEIFDEQAPLALIYHKAEKWRETYTVKPGDTLSRIGDLFQVPDELLMQINDIKRASDLQVGRELRVIRGPFHVRVRRSTKHMFLYLHDVCIAAFNVGLGQPGLEIPTGLWRVKSGGKLVKPTWTDPETGRRYAPDDPDYPLGTRWIGLEGVQGNAVSRMGFAIHGIRDASDLGKHTSKGCIVLKDSDVVQLYFMLVPEHSKVEVFD